MAPTFENVITNRKNDTWPDIRLFDCHDLEEKLGTTTMPRKMLPVAVLRITNLPPEDPEHQQIVARIEASVVTEEDLQAELRKLIEEYGDRPRDGQNGHDLPGEI